VRVAFVGVKRKYQELPDEYRLFFTQFHLELPYYFARDGKMDVTVTTVDYDRDPISLLPKIDLKKIDDLETDIEYGTLRHVEERRWNSPVDVVVHWRKWFPEFYRPEAINVINCQDHSFSPEWKGTVIRAYAEKKLHGILCFPKWHKRNIYNELGGNLDGASLIDGLTLGVDTEVYAPSPDKDPYQLLWASDPGRGLQQCLEMFMRLYVLDNRFRLNICWPDYCQPPNIPQHPGIKVMGNVPNGMVLRELFNRCGILPYASTFMEPSSRAHRQAMAAGSLVLYPPGMGTPSDLIENGRTGIVERPEKWHITIFRSVVEGWWKELGDNARQYAISENWAVQANRFREYFERII
jgi:hypothetical protein